MSKYIYIGYKEGKHWCREVNPYGNKPVYEDIYDPGWNIEFNRQYYFDMLNYWQTAESQLKEFEIETGVIAVYKDLSERIMFEHGKVLKPNDQFTGEQLNNKVRIC